MVFAYSRAANMRYRAEFCTRLRANWITDKPVLTLDSVQPYLRDSERVHWCMTWLNVSMLTPWK